MEFSSLISIMSWLCFHFKGENEQERLAEIHSKVQAARLNQQEPQPVK